MRWLSNSRSRIYQIARSNGRARGRAVLAPRRCGDRYDFSRATSRPSLCLQITPAKNSYLYAPRACVCLWPSLLSTHRSDASQHAPSACWPCGGVASTPTFASDRRHVRRAVPTFAPDAATNESGRWKSDVPISRLLRCREVPEPCRLWSAFSYLELKGWTYCLCYNVCLRIL